jgi:hypothetical protein
MSTVAKRTVRSSPFRDAGETWAKIVELLTQGKSGSAREALDAVAGIACSLITDQALKEAPLIATCSGPRTRIYCLYDESAIDAGAASEDRLGFDPLKDDWYISLPCPAEELSWVQPALQKHGSRISARDLASGIADEAPTLVKSAPLLTLNVERFLKS